MRGACVDSRKFQLLTTTRTTAAQVPAGVPVSTSWFTGENGPDGLPVWRTQMADQAPSGGWSWGSIPGYIMPALPAGQRIRIYWWMRGTNTSSLIQIARTDGSEGTGIAVIPDPPQWTRINRDCIIADASTGNSHQIRRAMSNAPGRWIEMTPPLIEIVGP